MQNSGLVSTGTGDSGPMDVFSVFDCFTVTDAALSHAHPKGSGRVESALGHGTNAVDRAASPETAPSSVVDQVLGALPDTNSHDTLIGDLAFEQVSSGIRKPWGSATIGTTS